MKAQEFSSKDTSLNQIPKLHKELIKRNMLEGINFDNGCGAYMLATNYLSDNGILNVRYDKYNVSKEVNEKANEYIGKCDTSTIANVLNVIKEEEYQLEVLKHSYDMLKVGGKCFISCYYSKGKKGGHTTKGWQNQKPLEEYIPLVKRVFRTVTKKYNMIIAEK